MFLPSAIIVVGAIAVQATFAGEARYQAPRLGAGDSSTILIVDNVASQPKVIARQPNKPQSQLTVATNRQRQEPIQPIHYASQPGAPHTATQAIALEPTMQQKLARSRDSGSSRGRLPHTHGQPQSRQTATIARHSKFKQARPVPKVDPIGVALLQAHEISLTAHGDPQYTQVIQLCARALQQGAQGEDRDFARQLFAWALNRRGQLRADLNQPVLALADFRSALDYVPQHWRALHNQGVSRAQAGQFAEAFDDFNQVIQLNPRFAKAYANRATLYVQAGDLKAALDDYDQSLRIDPTLLPAQLGRGRACHLLGRFEEALTHFDAAVELDGTNTQIICSRADLLADMGRYAAAMADYARAIDLDPEFAHAYRNGAWLLATCPDASLRDAENALIGGQRALEFGYGQRHSALDTLAAAQANAGQFDAAISTVQQAIELAPESVRQAYEVRLQLYQQHQPFRTSPLADVQQADFRQ